MNVTISKKDQLVMSLVHYFVTHEDYSPIVVHGAKEEIWLENLNGPYKVIRINTNYIHNNEQFEFDMAKIKHVIKQIKKKTMSFKLNVLNICISASERVEVLSNNNISSISIKDVNEIDVNKDLQEIFPNINNTILKKADNIDLLLNVTDDINKKTEKENKIFEDIFKSKKIVLTYVIIAICVIMFLLTYIFGDGSTHIVTLLNFGANNALLVKEGQIFRLITGIFLHAGILHLIVNMYSLFIIGTQVENFVGKIKFILIYLISGLMGSMLSIIFNDVLTVSVGASGAIFGLMGALLYFGYHYRLYLNGALRSQILPIILINLFIGFSSSGIDNAAHIGGLIGGFLAAMAFGIKGKKDKDASRNAIITMVILILFLGYMIFFR